MHARFKFLLSAAIFALVLAFAFSGMAQAQNAVEKDPIRCAAINLANLYLRWVNILHAIEMMGDDMRKGRPPQSQVERDAKKASYDQQVMYTRWIIALYQTGGRKFDDKVSTARGKIDDPHVLAALEEQMERVAQQLTGTRKPPKPNMYEECTVRRLGLEIHSVEKVNAHLRALQQEAAQLAQANRTCIKEN
jgi:hypothetical protein